MKTIIFIFLAISLSSPVADDKAEIDKYVERLKSKDAKVKVKALEDLATKGKMASSAIEPVCDLLLDRSPAVAKSALLAIEQIKPELYKPLTDLCLDETVYVNLRALEQIKKLGADASPTYKLLLARLSNYLKQNTHPRFGIFLDPLSVAYFNTINTIAPEKKDTTNLLRNIAKKTNANSNSRIAAMRILYDIAREDKEFIDEYLGLLVDGLSDNVCQDSCIAILASLGRKAAPTIPEIKKLKLSQDKSLRESVAKAIDAIETDKADEFKRKVENMKPVEPKGKAGAAEIVNKNNNKVDGNRTEPSKIDTRKKWLNESYGTTMIHFSGKKWIEVNNKSMQVVCTFTELNRTEEYIEFKSDRKDEITRMFKDKNVFFKNGKWEWLSNGKFSDE